MVARSDKDRSSESILSTEGLSATPREGGRVRAPELPCFSCRLPDCDETDRGCGLRRALNAYAWHLRHRRPAPPEVRALKNVAFNELYGDQHRARSVEQKARHRAAREAERADPS